MKEFIEIPFGAKDSELGGWEYTIPKGYIANIENGKIIVKKEESEDERIRRELIQYLMESTKLPNGEYSRADFFTWLEKQGENKSKKVSIWKHWKDGIAGNGEGELIYLTKVGNTYSLTSCLAFECDYIELSELDNLMLEKQGKQKPTDEEMKILLQTEYEKGKADAIEQKSAWSEEDKRKINRIYSILGQAADTHAFSTTCRLIGDKECVDLQDFIKSITLQNTWKPSDEQIQALEYQVRSTYEGSWQYRASKELLEQLKKL